MAKNKKQNLKKTINIVQNQDDEILEKKLHILVEELEELKKMTYNESKFIQEGKKKLGVTGYGENLRVGSGPAISGNPSHHEMGKTRNNFQIYSTPHKHYIKMQQNPDYKPNTTSGKPPEPYYQNFSGDDHRDAYFAHGQRAKELKESNVKVNPDLINHHNNMAKFHWDEYQNTIRPDKQT